MPVTIATLNTDEITTTEFVSAASQARDGKGRFNTIAPGEFATMDSMFDTSADCRAAYEAICAGLLCGPIMLSGMEVDERLERQMQSEYRVLCANAIRDLLRYGLVVITIDRKTMLPYTVLPTLLRVQHRSIIGGPSEYRIFMATNHTSGGSFMSGMDQRPLDDVIVFERSAPDAAGHLTGPMAALLNIEVFRNAMMKASAVAFNRMAMPGVYTVEKDTSVAQETINRDYTRIGESSALATETADVQEQLRADRERMAAQYRANAGGQFAGANPAAASRAALFGATGGGGAAGAGSFDPLLRVPQYGSETAYLEPPPEIRLPVNRDVKSAPMSQAPVGMADTEEAVEASVAKVFGVPQAVWTGQRRSSVATNQTALTAFYSSLQLWRTDLQAILHVMLTFCCGDIHVAQLAAFAEHGGREPVQVLDRRGKAGHGEAAAAAADADADADADEEKRQRDAKRKGKRGGGAPEKSKPAAALVQASAAAAAAGADTGSDTDATDDDDDDAGGQLVTAGGTRHQKVVVGEEAMFVLRSGRMFAPSRSLSITFPALLDASIIESLRATGAITWKTNVDMLSAYYGIDRRLLVDEQIEPATQMPLALETLRARRVEQACMDRGLVELAAAATTSEGLRKTAPNKTQVGGPPFTGATLVPAMPGNSSGGALKKKRKPDGDGVDEPKPKPAKAAIKSAGGVDAGRSLALEKGGVRTDRSKDPVTANATLRSAV